MDRPCSRENEWRTRSFLLFAALPRANRKLFVATLLDDGAGSDLARCELSPGATKACGTTRCQFPLTTSQFTIGPLLKAGLSYRLGGMGRRRIANLRKPDSQKDTEDHSN